MRPDRLYVAFLSRASRRAVPALARGLTLSRAAAAEAYAAAAALILAALARHQRRRGPEVAAAVVAKFGRPADVDAPDIAVEAHLARPGLDPRLGGLFGDDATSLARWLVERTGAEEAALGRAVAASAPLALGALARSVRPADLAAFLDGVERGALEAPARLLERDLCGRAFRRVRRAGRARFPLRVALTRPRTLPAVPTPMAGVGPQGE